MKKFKKLIAVLLSISMLTAMVGAIEAPENAAPASDTYTLDAIPAEYSCIFAGE